MATVDDQYKRDETLITFVRHCLDDADGVLPQIVDAQISVTYGFVDVADVVVTPIQHIPWWQFWRRYRLTRRWPFLRRRSVLMWENRVGDVVHEDFYRIGAQLLAGAWANEWPPHET